MTNNTNLLKLINHIYIIHCTLYGKDMQEKKNICIIRQIYLINKLQFNLKQLKNQNLKIKVAMPLTILIIILIINKHF